MSSLDAFGRVPTQMRLYFRCRIADADVQILSSGRFIVNVSVESLSSPGEWKDVGKTEVKTFAASSPIESGAVEFGWESSVGVNFVFERKQSVKLTLVDECALLPIVGATTVELGAIVGSASDVEVSLTLCQSTFAKSVTMLCHAVEQNMGSHDVLMLQLGATDLQRRNRTNPFSDTFVTITRLPVVSKLADDGDESSGDIRTRQRAMSLSVTSSLDSQTAPMRIWQSKVVLASITPQWEAMPPTKLGLLSGASATMNEKTLLIEVWQSNSIASNTSLGRVVVSVKELVDAAKTKRKIALRKSEKPHKNYGDLCVLRADLDMRPSFAEYLRAGYQVNLATAIDFTSSNADWRHPSSLHHFKVVDAHQQQQSGESKSDAANDGAEGDRVSDASALIDNEYLRAIVSVGEIVFQYDSDSRVPVYGFGAIVPNSETKSTVASHFFHVTLDPQEPCVQGIGGVVRAYKRCVPQLTFSGPTCFAPTIRAVTREARKTPNTYTILLLLTDADSITDAQETIDAIVEADDAPLSIIIVGIGNEVDAARMQELDCDGGFLTSSTGRLSRRDAVQYVSMATFRDRPISALAAETLAEIPDQFSLYAQLVGLPLPQRTAAIANKS